MLWLAPHSSAPKAPHVLQETKQKMKITIEYSNFEHNMEDNER